jgi:FtsZ-interacting cell division protein ZipA
MINLTLRERRLVAVALLLLLICVLLFAIITPILHGFQTRSDERAYYFSQMTRNNRSINNLPVWRQQADEQRRQAKRFEITAPSRTVAVEKFREEMVQFFTKNGGVVRGTEEIAPDTQKIQSEGDWLKLRIDSQMSLTQLVDGLRQLQKLQRVTVIDAITISADQAFTNGRLSPMDIRLEISIPYSNPQAR